MRSILTPRLSICNAYRFDVTPPFIFSLYRILSSMSHSASKFQRILLRATCLRMSSPFKNKNARERACFLVGCVFFVVSFPPPVRQMPDTSPHWLALCSPPQNEGFPLRGSLPAVPPTLLRRVRFACDLPSDVVGSDKNECAVLQMGLLPPTPVPATGSHAAMP